MVPAMEEKTPAEAKPSDPKKREREYAKEIERLTHCPGLVGAIINWIVDTARRPSRVLALGAAVTLIGTMVGRRIAGPTGSATYLYVIGIAPTASGKQHPANCIDELMLAAGAKDHIGPGEFISMPAIVHCLTRQPLALAVIDELGSYLKRINNHKASDFVKACSQVLRTLWGINFGLYKTPEWAGLKS